MYRTPARRAAATFTVLTVSISDDRKFQCIRAVIILLSPIYVPLFLLLSQPEERCTMMYVYISRGPKRPIVRDIVLTNLYITAALGLYIHGKRRDCSDGNEWRFRRIYARLVYLDNF